MQTFALSDRAAGAAIHALTSIGEARRVCPGLGSLLQKSVHLLLTALRSLARYVTPRTTKLPPAPIVRIYTPVRSYPRVELRAHLPLAAMEVNGSKALLLEIIRRAAYDWVLYRTSSRIQNRKLAEDAYSWLFKEEPGHVNWIERTSNKKDITAFLAICEALDLNVEMVRHHVRRLTIKNVMSVGRPAEYRRVSSRDEEDRFSTGGMDDRALLQEHSFEDEIEGGYTSSPFDKFDIWFLGDK